MLENNKLSYRITESLKCNDIKLCCYSCVFAKTIEYSSESVCVFFCMIKRICKYYYAWAIVHNA